MSRFSINYDTSLHHYQTHHPSLILFTTLNSSLVRIIIKLINILENKTNVFDWSKLRTTTSHAEEAKGEDDEEESGEGERLWRRRWSFFRRHWKEW